MAWCAIDGCDGPPDPDEARAAIDALRPVRRGRALYLEWLLDVSTTPLRLRNQNGTLFSPPEAILHVRLLHQAAAAGDTPALVELGIDAASRGNTSQARGYFQRAVAHSPAARADLKLLDDRGTSAGNGSDRADRLFQEASRFHRGDGVPLNYAEAIRLYRQAAAAGSAPARRMLEMILSRPAPGGAVNVGWMAQLAQLDLSSLLPRIDPGRFARFMVRDSTPLEDLIPSVWRQRGAADTR